MEFKKRFSWIAAAVLALVLWLWWWCQPERQVRRAQGRLVAALESRDFDAFAQLVADDYRVRWGHDKTNVRDRVREVFSEFALLDIERETRAVVPLPGTWVVEEKIHVKGLGGPLAMIARDRVNSLVQPFTMSWRKRSWKPWDWELTRVEQPEIEVQ